MNRAHKIFTYSITHSLNVFAPDPEAPGGGEMRRTGEVVQNTRDVVVIAETRAIADAWLQRPYYFKNLVVLGCRETTIDGIIETHTY